MGSGSASLEYRQSELKSASHALYVWSSSSAAWGSLNEPYRGLKVQKGEDYSHMQSLAEISCPFYSTLLPCSCFCEHKGEEIPEILKPEERSAEEGKEEKILDKKGKGREAESNWIAVNAEKPGEKQ